MPTYVYRCAEHGAFDVLRAVREADQPAACPTCGQSSARVFTAPMLWRTPKGVGEAVDRAERSREAPEVVTSLPPRRRQRAPTTVARNPALRRLPRP